MQVGRGERRNHPMCPEGWLSYPHDLCDDLATLKGQGGGGLTTPFCFYLFLCSFFLFFLMWHFFLKENTTHSNAYFLT